MQLDVLDMHDKNNYINLMETLNNAQGVKTRNNRCSIIFQQVSCFQQPLHLIRQQFWYRKTAMFIL